MKLPPDSLTGWRPVNEQLFSSVGGGVKSLPERAFCLPAVFIDPLQTRHNRYGSAQTQWEVQTFMCAGGEGPFDPRSAGFGSGRRAGADELC